MTFDNANNAFEFYYRHISSTGVDFDNTKAIFNESITVINPINNFISAPYRNWNESYAKKEFEWYMSGSRDVSEIKKIAPIWDKMHNGDNLVWSNYGWWWRRGNQLEHIVSLLSENKLTRRAVVVHYDPQLVEEFNNDTPCNLVLNFYVLNNRLHLTIFARSIDLWYGFCNDQWIFSQMMKSIASSLSLRMGEMTYMITNLHIYNNKLNKNT